MLVSECTLRLEIGTVESSCCGVAGAFRWEAANDETAMATGRLNLLLAADVLERAPA